MKKNLIMAILLGSIVSFVTIGSVDNATKFTPNDKGGFTQIHSEIHHQNV